MTVQEIENFISKNKSRHLSNKVLHVHPSPALWKNEFSYDDLATNLMIDEGDKIGVNMYIGIPYCLPTNPPHCGFCLFPTEKYTGKKDTKDYLDYVSKEADLYKNTYETSEIETLYIGGGTPNLLSIADYPRLMKIVNDLFPKMKGNIEKTLEGIPQLFTEDKIKAISDAGFNRVSMGVQQVNERLIKYSGRAQTSKQVFDAIEWFHKYGLACNVDLIYGWPEQTKDDMLQDLKEIIQSGIRHITHYELNIAGRSDFATQKKDLVPEVALKIEMYHAAKEYLISQHFEQKTVYDWEKREITEVSTRSGKEKYIYESNLRDFLMRDKGKQTTCMCGLGYAAINIKMKPLDSRTPSVSTLNHKQLSNYYDDVLEKRLPIERVFIHEREDVKICWLFQSLQEMKISAIKYQKIFNSSLTEDYRDIWNALENIEWIRHAADEILITGSGEFYVPLIQALLSKDRVDEISRRD